MTRIALLILVSFLLVPFSAIPVASDPVDQGSWDRSGPRSDEWVLEDVEQGKPRPLLPKEVPASEAQGEIRNLVDDVNEEYIHSYLTTLVGFGSRLYRAPGMVNASIWLHDVLDGQNGRLEASYHNFTVVRPTYGTFILSNVILTLPGVNQSSDRIYYMYAHSDAVQMDDPAQWLTNTPGADDDGSGCAAILEAARIMSRYEFQDTIKFLFVQAEEIGLYGSGYYAQNMTAWGENVQGGIDYDMIGTNNDVLANDLELMYNPASSDDADYLVDVNDRYGIGLDIEMTETTSSIPSDITRFYQNGFPSVMGIESEFSSVYHTTQDRIVYMNMTQMRMCTQLAVATLAEWSRLLYTEVHPSEDGLNVSNDYPSVGEEVDVTINISNTGTLNATDMEVAFYADGHEFDSARMWVPANSTNETSVKWTPSSVGNHVISVALDPSNEIVETNETNNTASIIVSVNDRPIAAMTANPLTVMTGEAVAFNGTLSSDQVGGIEAYNFTFGDGNGIDWTAEPAVEHSYVEDGTYTASLTVRDADGSVSTPSNLIIRVLNRVPTASPASDPARVLTFEDVQFQSSAMDLDGTVSIHWDLGDGCETAEADPVHQYVKAGTYDVALDILDNDGATASYGLQVMVDNRLPTTAINASALQGNVTTEFMFTAEASDEDGSIAAYAWDFGDGTDSGDLYVDKSFASPGTYNIVLEVTDDDGGKATDTLAVTIVDLPPVAYATGLPLYIRTFESVEFDARASYDEEGPLTYTWDLGDGNVSSLITVEHTYVLPGTYSATLMVTDTAGQIDTFELLPVTVDNRKPRAGFRTFGNFSENGTVYFDATGSTDREGPITFAWDFGDNTTGTGEVTDHVFPKAGSYEVRLTVTDGYGDTDIAVDDVVVIASPAPPPPPPPPDDGDGDDEPGVPLWMTIALLVSNLVWAIVLGLAVYLVAWSMRRRFESARAPQPQWQAWAPGPYQHGPTPQAPGAPRAPQGPAERAPTAPAGPDAPPADTGAPPAEPDNPPDEADFPPDV